MVQAQALPPVRLLALRGFAAHQLARMLHSLVRVSRRADGKPSASIARAQFSEGLGGAPFAASSRPGGRDGGSNAALVPPGQLDADQRPAHAAGRVGRREPGRTRGFPSLPPQQFQVLFNSLFKVLFIFPSRYLFAIGLPPVFSLRWDLPPAFGLHSQATRLCESASWSGWARADGVLTLSDAAFQQTWALPAAENASPDYNSPAAGRRFSRWALPASLAATRGILVSFFSSAD